MSPGSSVVKNNQLSQLPLKHHACAEGARNGDTSALSISFCQQARKAGEKDMARQLAS